MLRQALEPQFEMFPNLPEDGKEEVAQHLSNLVADEDYAPLGKLLTDATLPESVLDVLMADVLNRPNAVKLRAVKSHNRLEVILHNALVFVPPQIPHAARTREADLAPRDRHGQSRPILPIPLPICSTLAANEILTNPSPRPPNATPGITSTAASVASDFAKSTVPQKGTGTKA